MLLPSPSPVLEQFLLTKLSQREVKDWLQTYARPYRELMSCYRCAMMEIETKFNVLNEELSLQYDRNPIETIKTRLKSPESILEKLQRKGLPLTVESIEKNLNDIAGVRVICSHPADIYQLAEAFLKQDDITLLQRKDYIANPKPNGYQTEPWIFWTMFTRDSKSSPTSWVWLFLMMVSSMVSKALRSAAWVIFSVTFIALKTPFSQAAFRRRRGPPPLRRRCAAGFPFADPGRR